MRKLGHRKGALQSPICPVPRQGPARPWVQQGALKVSPALRLVTMSLHRQSKWTWILSERKKPFFRLGTLNPTAALSTVCDSKQERPALTIADPVVLGSARELSLFISKYYVY